jgi:hypothetical protein
MTTKQPNLTVRVDPNEMVQYVHTLMTTPGALARDASGAGSPSMGRRYAAGARGAAALERAQPCLRRCAGQHLDHSPERDQIHVPAALIAAAGVARLTMAEQEVVFDIPTLLDATLELCEPVGHG